MYLNVLEYELSCTGIYWKFEIVQYWKIKNVLENVLECTGISSSILCGHPAMEQKSTKESVLQPGKIALEITKNRSTMKNIKRKRHYQGRSGG